MKKIFIISICFVLTILVAGCDINETSDIIVNQAIDNVTSQVTSFNDYPDWYTISDGMQIKEYVTSDLINEITVIKIDPTQFDFKVLEDSDNPKSVTEWRETQEALLVVNAAYFDENKLFPHQIGIIVPFPLES